MQAVAAAGAAGSAPAVGVLGGGGGGPPVWRRRRLGVGGGEEAPAVHAPQEELVVRLVGLVRNEPTAGEGGGDAPVHAIHMPYT